MTKYTQGPWSVYDSGYYPGIESESSNTTIVTFGYSDEEQEIGIRGKNKEEITANANLIAAAPEMFEALQMVIQSDENDSLDRMDMDLIYKAVNNAGGKL